jgi:hypothetical protein
MMSKEKFISRESKEIKNLPLSAVEDYFRKINQYENLTNEKRIIMEQYYSWEKMSERNEKIIANFKKQWDEIENQLNSLRKSLDDMREKNPALLDAERYFNLYQEYYRLIDEIKKLRDERGEIVLKEAQISNIRNDEAEEKLEKELPSHPYKILSEKIKAMDKRKGEVHADAENMKKILPDDVVKRLDSKIMSRIRGIVEKEEGRPLQVAQKEKVILDESQQKEEKIIQQSNEQVDKSETESEKNQEEKESEVESIVLKGQKIELEYPGEPIDIYLGDKYLQIVDVRNDKAWNADYLVIDPEGKGYKGIRENEPVVLGRQSPYRFEFPQTVSRLHLKIELVGGKLIIEDLDSTNGTIVEIKKKRGENKFLGEALKRAMEFIKKLNPSEQDKKAQDENKLDKKENKS